MKYRKKPVVIEAMGPLRPDNWFHIFEWMRRRGAPGGAAGVTPDNTPYITIETLEGSMHASPGDWIIRGVQGEFYPCKPDIFTATYEAVDEGPGPLTELPGQTDVFGGEAV
jgi:hypothetical protein